MKPIQFLKSISLLLPLLITSGIYSQINAGVYISDEGNVHHELKVDGNYLIYSIYEKSPAKFLKTLGGFYMVDKDMLNIQLEFNSNFENDADSEIAIPIEIKDEKLILKSDTKLIFEFLDTNSQALDGAWLFATRGPDKGNERRGEEYTRKTLKFLINGRFQWVAYDTEGMQFKGTGGGSYTSKDGVYTENIEFFSRDDSRVGASLEFNYETKGDDWHHTGNNSKGEPLYEIWGRRK